MPASFQFNGKEIESPAARTAARLLAIAIVGILVGILALGISMIPILLATLVVGIVCLIVFTIPIHLTLRKMGRRGFIIEEDNTIKWSIDCGALKRREED